MQFYDFALNKYGDGIKAFIVHGTTLINAFRFSYNRESGLTRLCDALPVDSSGMNGLTFAVWKKVRTQMR